MVGRRMSNGCWEFQPAEGRALVATADEVKEAYDALFHDADLRTLGALLNKFAEAVGWNPGDDLDLVMTAQELRDIKEALDLLESDEHLGAGLISDDFGNWAVSGSGFQQITDDEGNVPTKEKPVGIVSTFFVDADEWSGSIRDALRAFVKAAKEE